MLRHLAYFIVTILRMFIPCKVYGKENIKDNKTLYICNHQSICDIVVLLAHLPLNTFFMAKKEVFKIKLVGWVLKKVGAFPVDRQSVDLKSIKFACSKLNENNNLMIFPQGTRKDSPRIQLEDMHAGVGMIALKTGATVVPMMFKEKPQFFKKNVLIIGKPMDLSEFQDKKSNSETLSEFTKKATVQMNALLGEI
ncbi:MAG: 1-acyl-sn-glycerol-3-phosphate acyltransferase [Clostridiales bacterium]|nr:1-acyl-sn-glycerol-3-phosphate acyltransferase [Clostridiales bacterium]